MQGSGKRTQGRPQEQAMAVRNQAIVEALKRKEEYLGARVPRELREKVFDRAKKLGIPVSILIRNILEEAFAAGVPAMAERTGARADISPGPAARFEDRFAFVLGWEDMRLNRPHECSGCGKSLRPGAAVAFGVTANGERRVILCNACKELI